MQYDEDTELTEYIWSNYQSLMTEAEVFAHKGIGGTPAEFDELYEKRFGKVVWREMKELERDEYPAFRKRVRDRLLSECRSKIEIVKCPLCERIVKTPLAKQYLWCGHDWHTRTISD